MYKITNKKGIETKGKLSAFEVREIIKNSGSFDKRIYNIGNDIPYDNKEIISFTEYGKNINFLHQTCSSYESKLSILNPNKTQVIYNKDIDFLYSISRYAVGEGVIKNNDITFIRHEDVLAHLGDELTPNIEKVSNLIGDDKKEAIIITNTKGIKWDIYLLASVLYVCNKMKVKYLFLQIDNEELFNEIAY